MPTYSAIRYRSFTEYRSGLPYSGEVENELGGATSSSEPETDGHISASSDGLGDAQGRTEPE